MKKICLLISLCITGFTVVAADMVPLKLDLPPEAFKGTPKDLVVGPDVEPFTTNARPVMMVPAGLVNVAKGAKVTCSDKNPDQEGLAKITDGDKRGEEGSVLTYRKGTQYIQMDLGEPKEVFAVVIWHAHNTAKVYRDVIVQLSDDPEFAKDVKTLFNNDRDNSSSQGVGTDREYFETREGRLIDAKGQSGRYMRFYSKGSNESALNECTEIEVYGRPAGK